MGFRALGFMILSGVIIIGCEAKDSTSDACDGVTCTDGQTCNATTGDCETPPPECVGASDCEDNEVCSAGKCLSECDFVTCDANAGMTCDPDTGTCKGGLPCPADGCGENQICENEICVAARLQECGSSLMCASGLNCQAGPSGKVCVAPCESRGECAMMERCYLDAPGPLAGFLNHCFINLCEPTPRDPFGIFQAAEYLGSCNADGEDDGLCMGPINNDGIGFCVFQGTIAGGEACDSTALQSGGADAACDGGMCIPGQNFCGSACKLFDSEHACPDTFACAPAFVTSDAFTGFCFSVGDSAPGLGESCTVGENSLTCQDGMICAPESSEDGAGTICRALCDPGAAAGEAGACPDGEVCTSSDGEDLSGIGGCVAASSGG